jgi:thiol-disulfide isomerase/thioredoxin
MNAKTLFFVFATAITCAAAEPGKNALPEDADAAWKEVETLSKPPLPPAEWAGKAPTEEQRKAFYESLADKSEVVAERAKEFYTRFPNHQRVEEAKKKEEVFRKQATQFRGNSGTTEKVSPEEKAFREKMNDVQKRALKKRDPAKPRNGMPEVVKELEDGLREVMKEYPDRAEPWQQLLSVAEYADKDDQLRMLGDIVKAKAADEQTVTRAKAAIRAVGALGHPLELSFTAADGREVDVQKMKGKVVLVDFWAAWCGPCISSLPEVVELHKKYQPQGFEIVGINMDKNQEHMEQVVHRFKMPWPQYFDGKGWATKFALEYNVTAIPAVWLVDKKGVLRTMNAREDLETRIKELLEEKI